MNGWTWIVLDGLVLWGYFSWDGFNGFHVKLNLIHHYTGNDHRDDEDLNQRFALETKVPKDVTASSRSAAKRRWTGCQGETRRRCSAWRRWWSCRTSFRRRSGENSVRVAEDGRKDDAASGDGQLASHGKGQGLDDDWEAREVHIPPKATNSCQCVGQKTYDRMWYSMIFYGIFCGV